MAVISARKTSVVNLSLEEASDFIQENSSVQLDELGKRPQALGLIEDGKLIAAAVFCNPRTREDQALYTTELFRLECQDSEQAATLISHFASIPKTVDFFLRPSSLDFQLDSPAEIGMELSALDQVYEWRDPDFSSYVYRITSTADDGYYYGRHGTWLSTLEEMLLDGYMGSGGVKYKNWVKSVGAATLRKEILEVHSCWSDAVKAEELLIADSYRTDANCKNSKPGGTGLGSYFPNHEEKQCSTHGLSWHQGNSCKKCVSQTSYSLRFCSIHGESAFHGEGCLRCRAKEIRSVKVCPVHGETGYLGAFCNKCLVAQSYSEKHCEMHGNSIHQGATCKSCVTNASISVRDCPVHSETKHIGDKCRKCINDSSLSLKLCPVHGETLHQSDACATCVSQRRIVLKTCSIHGETKFLGNNCATCATQKIVSLKPCPAHGESKHVGEHCKKCMAAKAWGMKECPIHGETKHNGDSCSKCKSAKMWTVEECSIHGESKHKIGKCHKCALDKRKAAKVS